MFLPKSFILNHPNRLCLSRGTRKLLQVLRGGNDISDDEKESDADITIDDESERDSDSDNSSSFEEIDDDVEETEDDYDDDEYDSEQDYEENMELEAMETSETVQDTPYDALIPASPIQQMAISFGVMYFSKKLDFNSPEVIKWSRISFLSYILLTQVLSIYVRISARRNNDTTPISMSTHPLLSNLLPSNTPSIAKDLASKILSSQSTIMEYDLAQATQMSNKLLFSLLFMWFLHFKMGQVQPLLYQASSGIFTLVNSPLWQSYVWGRNLERPWKMVGMNEQVDEEKVSEVNEDGEEKPADEEIKDDVEKDEIKEEKT